MTLARILLKLWTLRRWVGVGVLLALVAAVGSVKNSRSTVYATASTQMLVDSPASALADSGVDLGGYATRAGVFARLMTSAEALKYIGQAAGIPGNLIDANGPVEINGSPTAAHAPMQIKDGKDLPAPTSYELSFVQNPSLPTVDVYARAPTTAQAVALANGAVTGFANFVNQLDIGKVPLAARVEIRQLGGATGGIVDSGASKKIAILVFLGALAAWCGVVLFVSRLRADLRAAKQSGTDDLFGGIDAPFAVPDHPPASVPHQEPGRGGALAVDDDLPRFVPAADARVGDADARPFHRALTTARVGHNHHDTWDPNEQRVGARQGGVRGQAEPRP